MALSVVFVAVLLDSLRVHHLLALPGSGRSVDRSFVVSNQGNQSGQGGCVSVPANGYVEATARIDSASASVDLVDRVLDLAYAFNPLSLGLTNSHPLRLGVSGLMLASRSARHPVRRESVYI